MPLTEQEIKNAANDCARKLLAGAFANEPEITRDLQAAAFEVPAELFGLEDRFKSQHSLADKITRRVQRNIKILTASGRTPEEAFEKALQMQSGNTNDVLRYTFVLSFNDYAFSFKRSLEKLRRKDYRIPENKIWNAWRNVGTEYDKGYRGINVTVISSQGQMFEIQFHTKESFRLKTETHDLYKQAVSSESSSEKRMKAVQTMIESAGKVPIPKGVKKL
jgi:hypothetical protein